MTLTRSQRTLIGSIWLFWVKASNVAAKKFSRFLAPAFGLALLAFLILHYDRSAVLASFAAADLLWVGIVALSLIVTPLLGAVNVFLLFEPNDRVLSFWAFLKIYWFGWAVALVVPGQVGDVASTTVLLRKRGVPMSDSLGLLLIDKVISLAVMLCFALVGLYAVRRTLDVEFLGLHRLAIGATVLILCFLAGLAFLHPRSRFSEHRLARFTRDTISRILETCRRHPLTVGRNAAITVVKLFVTGLAYHAAMRGLGADLLIVSNAAGGVHSTYRVGEVVVIDDHINMMFQNPLIGINDDHLGSRFPDMSSPYDPALIEQVMQLARAQNFTCHRGVYVGMLGPNYETRAEYRFLRRFGGDVVGMSTVPEVLAAVHAGMRVLAISIVSNYAAGLTEAALSHDEVTDVVGEAADRGWRGGRCGK